MVDQEESWGFEGEEVTEATLEAVRGICDKLFELREKKDSLETQAKLIQEDIKKTEGRLLGFLKEAGLNSFDHPRAKFLITTRETYAGPAGEPERQALFDYLKKQGLFDTMITIHSQTLSSWAKQEAAAKEEEGQLGWVPPGLKPPSKFDSITVRKR